MGATIATSKSPGEQTNKGCASFTQKNPANLRVKKANLRVKKANLPEPTFWTFFGAPASHLDRPSSTSLGPPLAI